MGLYDGADRRRRLRLHRARRRADRRAGDPGASTSPSVSRTAAAVVHGLATFDPAVRIAGVILNKAGSARHADEVTPGARGHRHAGARRAAPRRRDRGARRGTSGWCRPPSGPRPPASSTGWPTQVAEHVDLAAVLGHRPPRPTSDRDALGPGRRRTLRPATWPRPAPARWSRSPAAGRSRSATPRPTSCSGPPAASRSRSTRSTDTTLPAGTAGLYLGGGFPEVHAAELAGNAALRAAIARGRRRRVCRRSPSAPGCSTCAVRSTASPMVGALDADAAMTPRLTLRYRTAGGRPDQLLAAAGTPGHRARVPPHRRSSRRPGAPAGWLVDGQPVGFSRRSGRSRRPTLHASYLHIHWAGHPQLAQRFADAVHDHAAPTVTGRVTTCDHHGDGDIADGPGRPRRQRAARPPAATGWRRS